jgi:nucleotide-binding universal stress UspA family protein
MTNLITEQLEAAYNGEDGITLEAALCRIAAEFYDPYAGTNQQTGVVEERNRMAFIQMKVLQNLANTVYADLYEPRPYTDAKGVKRVKGIAHKADQARRYAKSLAARATANDGEALIRAADWLATLEAQEAELDAIYHTIAAVAEAATGNPFKPYEPWASHQYVAKDDVQDEALAAAKEKLAALGIAMNEPYVANTNGVETDESEAA